MESARLLVALMYLSCLMASAIDTCPIVPKPRVYKPTGAVLELLGHGDAERHRAVGGLQHGIHLVVALADGGEPRGWTNGEFRGFVAK
jgi:hypothetical protein